VVKEELSVSARALSSALEGLGAKISVQESLNLQHIYDSRLVNSYVIMINFLFFFMLQNSDLSFVSLAYKNLGRAELRFSTLF
jgi:hypothetical protein